jgi:hypothetical protein
MVFLRGIKKAKNDWNSKPIETRSIFFTFGLNLDEGIKVK